MLAVETCRSRAIGGMRRYRGRSTLLVRLMYAGEMQQALSYANHSAEDGKICTVWECEGQKCGNARHENKDKKETRK